MSDNKPFTFAVYQDYLNEGKLMATKCACCGNVYIPPRAICPETHESNMEWVELSGKGKIAAFTIIHIAPTAMVVEGYGRDNPYCSGIVELEEGARISAFISGVDAKQPENIKIGTPVNLAMMDRGVGEEKRAFLAFSV